MNVTVITGAANGIGLALSQVHLHQGDILVMVDKDQAKLDLEAERLKERYPKQILAMACDITETNEVMALAKRVKNKWGVISRIYNNAGIMGQLAPVWELDPGAIEQVMDVNVHGVIKMIQAFMPYLLEQNSPSHIINIASLYALCSSTYTAAYAMSKHALLALSEALYFDLAKTEKSISVSVAFPSFTDTGLLSLSPKENSSFHEALQPLLSHARPALEVAQCIIEEVRQKKFYIFPDKEVKRYCDERTQAILLQTSPHQTHVEKLMRALIKRQEKRKARPITT